MARTNRINSVANTAGQASGSVTRRATCSTFAPLMMADSSSAGSMARTAAVIRNMAAGEYCKPSTQTMPASE